MNAVQRRRKKRSVRARPLVGGYLERISVKAFEKYHTEITELVKTQHGVYALYKHDRLYYVGLAGNLRRRIKQHLRDKHAGRWNRFSLYLVRKVDHIKEIESLLLRIADPAGNKQAGRLQRATNLERRLRRLMQQRVRAEIDEIFQPEPRATKPPRAARAAVTRRARTKRGRGDDRPLKGLLGGGKQLYGSNKGREYQATVYGNGRIKFDGKFYDTPSAAGKAALHRGVNGWRFWKVRKSGVLIRLGDLRA